jgi:hypothetical protein
MANDDFDLSDFGTFDEPQLSPEQEGEVPPIPEPPRQAGRNTTFVIGAIVGIIVFVLALCLVAYFIFNQAQQVSVAYITQTYVASANAAVETSIAMTQTAKAWSPTPSDTPTFTPTYTFTPSPTFTPSSTPTVTLTPSSTIDTTGTQNAINTQLAVTESNGATQTAFALTQQAQQTQTAMQGTFAAQTATAGATTPTGPTNTPGGPTETATVVSQPVTIIPAATLPLPLPVYIVTLTRTPKPAQTCTTNLPCTGLFDDFAEGKATPGTFAFIGAATLGLVGVIVVSRRLRGGR